MSTAARGRLNIRLLFVMLAMLAFAADVRVRAVNPSESSAQQLKAGYVYNFAKLVEWPASVAPNGPIIVGVVGDDDFADVLGRVMVSKTPEDRTFVVKPVKIAELKTCGCRILFVASVYSDWTADIVRLQNSASVLTIAEAPDFARRGGIVGLTLDGRKVRLVVNVDAAERASLSISSRLLALATIVHTAR
jgi:hypothetical protein